MDDHECWLTVCKRFLLVSPHFSRGQNIKSLPCPPTETLATQANGSVPRSEQFSPWPEPGQSFSLYLCRLISIIRANAYMVHTSRKLHSVTNVVTQTALCPLSPFNVVVYGLECKNQPVNVTLMGRRRRGSLIRSLNTRVFETRTATGSELFSLLTCLDTTTFISLSI